MLLREGFFRTVSVLKDDSSSQEVGLPANGEAPKSTTSVKIQLFKYGDADGDMKMFK